MKSVLDYLNKTEKQYADKILYADENSAYTFSEVRRESRRIASFLAGKIPARRPVVVLTQKSARTLVAYMGVVSAGCFYVPIDSSMPALRIKTIIDKISPDVILSDRASVLPEGVDESKLYTIEDILASDIEISQEVYKREEDIIDTDALYVIFTSGSTGTPKGVVASHRGVIDYIDAVVSAFGIDDTDILGNQSPLDYDGSIRDIYGAMKTGATMQIIPKQLFSVPIKLFEYLNEKKITSISWAVSAVSLPVTFGAFEKVVPAYIKRVLFAGSVMPPSKLKVWQENLPDAMYVNHYGPTETTGTCTYHIVSEKVSDDTRLPIGKPFYNTRIVLIKEDGSEAKTGEVGEICVVSNGLALGYFGDVQKTGEVFVQNPLNKYCCERMYKTGDLAKADENGVLWFHGRQDHQIKHMGHRIELGEIECAAKEIDRVKDCACLYFKEKEHIYLFYVGENINKREITLELRKRLPDFMLPRRFVRLEKLPLRPNGKTDLEILKGMLGKKELCE